MKAITDQSQQQVFAALDDLTAKLCAAFEAGNEAAKVLLVWLESLNAKTGNQNGSSSSTTPDDGLMTADEVGNYMRIGKQTIYTWVNDKKIPHLRVNNEIRFRRSVIDDWMESNITQIQTEREKSRQPVIRSRRSFPTANR